MAQSSQSVEPPQNPGRFNLIALIAHKELGMGISLRNFLHLVEVNMFEKIMLKQMVTNAIHNEEVYVLQLQDELL